MTMKRTLLALALSATLAGAAFGQTPDDGLYRALGERAGIERLADDFVERITRDARIGHTFDETNLKELAKQIADQFCVLAGGPCVYEGATMKDAHAETRIDKADFHRIVELLQDAMDRQSLPFAVQNRLLALLAPMHRDIINAR
jgi:hemoglobin